MKGDTLAKVLIGGFLVFLGLGFLADQLFNVDFGRVLGTFWPLAIMLIGVYIIIRTKSQLIFGSIVFLVGTGLLVDQLFDLPFSIWNLWPLILVLVGVRILLSDHRHINRFSSGESTEDTFESTAIFWGDSKKVKSDNLKMGKITALFGGNEIDLTDSKMVKDGAHIDIVAMFGGVTIKVNSNTLVKSEGLGVFGGFEDKSSKPAKPEGTITVKGTAMFGGVEIKN